MGSHVAAKAACLKGRLTASPHPVGDDDAGLAREQRRAAIEVAARDWLETQARVVEYWRDLLVDAGEDGALVEALDAHAAFLSIVSRGNRE